MTQPLTTLTTTQGRKATTQMTAYTTSLTDEEGILQAIKDTPEGPIVLWHYSGPNDPKHRARRARLKLTCECVGENVYIFNGAHWRLVNRSNGNGGGFATLELVVEHKTPQPEVHNHRKDYKAWWAEECARRGWLKDSARTTAPQHTARPDFGYDYAPDE